MPMINIKEDGRGAVTGYFSQNSDVANDRSKNYLLIDIAVN